MRRALILLIWASLLVRIAAGAPSPEENYMRLKSAGDYGTAIALLRDRTAETDDTIAAEINLFRIRELTDRPEFIAPALDALRTIAGSPVLRAPFLRSRLDNIAAELHLRAGNLRAAEAIAASAGYLDFIAAGPYMSGAGDGFEQRHPPEETSPAGGPHRDPRWFSVEPDRTGVIRMDELMPCVKDSFYYFRRSFFAPEEGEYYLILGKTGYTDLWLDGVRVFSERTRHGFDHDQYFIHVRLPAGPHLLLVKSGDSNGKLALSLRIASAGGMSLPLQRSVGQGTLSLGSLVGVSYFPALASLVREGNHDGGAPFLSGYLLVQTKLWGRESPAARDLLSSVGKDDPYRAAARCYLATMAPDLETKDRHLREALLTNPNSAEALHELASLKISRGFIYDAWSLIAVIGAAGAPARLRAESTIRLFIKSGWNAEALRAARALGNSSFPSAGLSLEASLLLSERDYHGAIPISEKLLIMDRYRASGYLRLLSCYEKTGSWDCAERILGQAIALFPNRTDFKLRMAAIAEKKSGPGAAIPHLAAALKRAPVNWDALRALGMAYHRIGKRSLAIDLLSRASALDPDNHALREYLRHIRGDVDELDRFRSKASLSSMAAGARPYQAEPAVTLLDETLISVTANGSFEKRVRRVVLVNTAEEARRFSIRPVVFDPHSERVEDLSLTLVRGAERIPVTGHYRTPLSEPESRRYYRLEALRVPLPSLSPGDIIELNYTIKNRGGKEYRGHFGDRLIVGGDYRTMAFHIALIHPEGKPVYCHLKDIAPGGHSVSRSGTTTVHLVNASDIPPLAKERSMPHPSRFLPAVFFTSFRSWDGFHGWYGSLLKGRIRVDGEMRDALRSIGALKGPPIERVRAVYAHVASSIRYAGFEFGMAGIRPRFTDETYHSKMGDCKDVSLLLVALLREAGIDARLALVRTRDRGAAPPGPPSPGEFNHALCYVNITPGFFLDATASGAGIREIPPESRGVPAFVFGDNGWSFINTESDFYLSDSAETSTIVTLRPSGDAGMQRNLEKVGSSAPPSRESLKNLEGHTRHLNEYWNATYPGSSVKGLTVSRAGVDGPLSYAYTATVPAFAARQDDLLIFDSFPIKSDYYRLHALPRSRVRPLALSNPWTTRTVVTFLVPEGYHVSRLPSGGRFDHRLFSAEFSYSSSGGAVTALSVIEMKRSEIGPGDYPRFREFSRFIDRKERERIILSERSPVDPTKLGKVSGGDSPVIDDEDILVVVPARIP